MSETPKLLLLSEADNVYVVLGALGAGPALSSDGTVVQVGSGVTLGHKVARRDVAAGEKILKYGAPIGSATADIPAGAHVHVHNMKSDYTPTHALDETSGGGT